MNFIQNIKNSIYSPAFYTAITKRSFKSSFGYFFLLILFLTIISVIFLIKPLLIDTPTQIQNMAVNLVNCFPKELEVNVAKGQLTSNQNEPYFIPTCKDLNMEGDQNLAVIDTKTPYSSEKFDEYKASMWVTKDSVFYKRNSVETRSYSLTQIQNFKLNKSVIDAFYKSASPYLKFVGPALLVISFIGIYLAYAFRLVYLLILGALIWLLSKVFKHALSFGQSYKIGLYAITLGLIVELVINLTGKFTGFYGFPFMFTIISLGVVTINLFIPKKAS